MKNKFLSLILPLILAANLVGLSACQPTPKEQPKSDTIQMNSQLKQTHWVLNTLNDKKVVPKTTKNQPYFVLSAKENKINGYSGCNHFFGTYRNNPKAAILNIGQLASTLMACMDNSINEYNFLRTLEQTQHYKIKDNTLTLLNSHRKVLASFTAIKK